MPELKELQTEFNSLVREVKDLQAEWSGKDEPREALNTLQAKADRMDELSTAMEGIAERKRLDDRLHRHTTTAAEGAGHVDLVTGQNPTAGEGEEKDGWRGVIDRKSGHFLPIWHKDVLAVRPDLRASCQPEYKSVFDKYVRGQEKFLSSEERGILQQGSMELKALSEGSNTGGGYAVPVDFIPELIQRLPGQAEFTQDARHVTTNRDTVVAPRIKANATTPNMYPSAIQGTWVSENPSASTGLTAPVWEQVSITVNTAKLETILSKNFVSDAAVNIGGYLTEGFGLASLLMKDQAFLKGTGLAQPRGVAGDGSITSITSGAVAGITSDDPKEMIYQTAKQYWTGAKFYVSRDALRLWREKKDGNGNYIWSPGFDHGMDGGVPATLEGVPYAVTDFLDTAGSTGNLPAIFGNAKFYWVVDRLEMSIQVLNELYAESNQIAYLAFFRVGGMAVVPEAFRYLTVQ